MPSQKLKARLRLIAADKTATYLEPNLYPMTSSMHTKRNEVVKTGLQTKWIVVTLAAMSFLLIAFFFGILAPENQLSELFFLVMPVVAAALVTILAYHLSHGSFKIVKSELKKQLDDTGPHFQMESAVPNKPQGIRISNISKEASNLRQSFGADEFPGILLKTLRNPLKDTYMMYTKADMVYAHEYDWHPSGMTDPRIASALESLPINRAEGNEVLTVINQVLTETGANALTAGPHFEKLLIDHLPDQNWSRKQVVEWLCDNYLVINTD